MSRIAKLGCLLAAAFMSAHALAQTIPAMDFAKRAEVYEVALSPDGKYVAMTKPTADGLETQLHIVEIASGKTQILRFGRFDHVANIAWSNNDRLVLARATTVPFMQRPVSRGQIFSTDVTGKQRRALFGAFDDDRDVSARHHDNGFSSVEKVLDREPGKILISYQCWDCGEDPDTVIYKVDSATGARQEIERFHGNAWFVFDNAGRARVRTSWNKDDNPVLAYRPTAASDWMPVPEALAGYEIVGARFAKDDNTLFAVVSDRGEAARPYKIDMAAGARTALPDSQASNPSYYELDGRDGFPFATVYDENKPAVEYTDPASKFAPVYGNLMRSFPGQMVHLEDFSLDGNTVLFNLWSDRNPRTWYLLDRASGKITRVAESRPWIDPAKMAARKPIQFRGDDGITLHGFYTANGNGPKPLIVIPHGGPHGIYDAWEFDDDAQFFANRGYGVLQVNFRGSGGRGHAFEESGYRQWGGKMQDDIAAGVKWTIANNLADPKRICTFGASYGGYAALMQTVRFPELYRCAIGYAGVYDLSLMKKVGDIDRTKSGQRYLDRVLGTDRALMDAWSPARNTGKIKVPVFLAQGTIDQRVPMEQFNALVSAFRKDSVKVETMVAPREGHGFYKPENIATLYDRVDEFLQKNDAP